MGYEDGGGVRFIVDSLEFGAHGDSQLRVQIGEGFVHEKYLWLDSDGARHRHSLLLPAR